MTLFLTASNNIQTPYFTHILDGFEIKIDRVKFDENRFFLPAYFAAIFF
jgi:hypothetical protein